VAEDFRRDEEAMTDDQIRRIEALGRSVADVEEVARMMKVSLEFALTMFEKAARGEFPPRM
jgi:hypothetical protein